MQGLGAFQQQKLRKGWQVVWNYSSLRPTRFFLLGLQTPYTPGLVTTAKRL